MFEGAVVRIKLSIACVGRFTDENHDAINTLATVCIALFTLALWISTHRLWQAGERQIAAARKTAIVAAEQTKLMEGQLSIIVEQTRIMEMQTNISAAGLDIATAQKEISRSVAINAVRPYLVLHTNFGANDRYIAGTSDTEPFFEYWFTNHGTAPAVIKESMQDISLAVVLRHSPADQNRKDLHYYVVLPGNNTRRSRVRLDSGFTEADLMDVGAARKHVFAFGFVRYEGITGYMHETRFCWMYHHAKAEFNEYGGQEYNRRT